MIAAEPLTCCGIRFDCELSQTYPLIATMITADNAKQLSALANKARWDKWREKHSPKPAIETSLGQVIAPNENPIDDVKSDAYVRVEKQLALCDELLDECKDADDFAKLTASKERLWKLIMPTAGVLRPKSDSKKRRGGAR